MKFNYQKVPSSTDPAGSWVLLPLIKVRLSNNEKQIQINALIDSGADASLFHASIARALDIDLKTGIRKEFFGISGHSIEVYVHPVNLQIVGSSEILKVNVGFTDSEGVGALLGEADFFENHQIKFERYKENLEINPAKK